MSNGAVQIRFLSGREAADFLGIGKSTLYELAKNGQIPYVPIGKRMKFRSDELERQFRGTCKASETCNA